MDATPSDLVALHRQLTWDTVWHGQLYDKEILEHFGLAPTSEEVLDKEHEESHRRLEMTYPYNERIRILSALVARIARKGILDPQDGEPLEEDLLTHLSISLAICSTAIVADLIDKGLLKPTMPEDNLNA